MGEREKKNLALSAALLVSTGVVGSVSRYIHRIIIDDPTNRSIKGAISVCGGILLLLGRNQVDVLTNGHQASKDSMRKRDEEWGKSALPASFTVFWRNAISGALFALHPRRFT